MIEKVRDGDEFQMLRIIISNARKLHRLSEYFGYNWYRKKDVEFK